MSASIRRAMGLSGFDTAAVERRGSRLDPPRYGPQRPSPMGACTASIASGPPCPRECGGLCRPVERTASGPHPSARGGPRPCTWTVQLVQRTPSRTDRRASHRPMSVSRVERTASGASPVSAWRASPLHVDGAARPANAVTDRPSSASGRLHTLEVSSAFPPSDPGASEHSTKPQTRHISAVLFNLYIHTYL